MDEQEHIKELQDELLEILMPNLPKEGIGSFVVNTDYLKKQIGELFPGFEVTITPRGAYDFEVNLKKMVNVIEIEIDTDKIKEEVLK